MKVSCGEVRRNASVNALFKNSRRGGGPRRLRFDESLERFEESKLKGTRERHSRFRKLSSLINDRRWARGELNRVTREEANGETRRLRFERSQFLRAAINRIKRRDPLERKTRAERMSRPTRDCLSSRCARRIPIYLTILHDFL